jgi:hypothetical protein
MSSRFPSTLHDTDARRCAGRLRRIGWLGTAFIALAALLPGTRVRAAQDELAHTKELGRAVGQYEDALLQVVVAYNYSQREHGSRWILIQAAVASRRPMKIRREGFFLQTPDVRVIDLASQRRFGADTGRLNSLLQSSSNERHPVDWYFKNLSRTQSTENMRLFVRPGQGVIQDEFVTSDDRVMVGDLFFENPRGLWASGRYILTVQTDRAKAELPIDLN